MGKAPGRATFFATPAAFRAWLAKNHQTADELLVGFHKKGSGRPSITWPESVDEALCVGWIDGIRRRIDDDSYSIRFTPRRATSIWSAINIKRVAELTKLGRMRKAGLDAFALRTDRKSGIYGYEQKHLAVFTPEQQEMLNGNAKARAFWETLPPGYRRSIVFWATDAKKPETRLKRMKLLVAKLAKGERVE